MIYDIVHHVKLVNKIICRYASLCVQAQSLQKSLQQFTKHVYLFHSCFYVNTYIININYFS